LHALDELHVVVLVRLGRGVDAGGEGGVGGRRPGTATGRRLLRLRAGTGRHRQREDDQAGRGLEEMASHRGSFPYYLLVVNRARSGLRCLDPRSAAARRDWSTYTAATSTVPTATPCQKASTPMMTNPACSTAGMNRPTTVPKIEPSPPKIDVPPITTAAMTLRLVNDWPAMVVVPNCASDSTAPNPAIRPEIA